MDKEGPIHIRPAMPADLPAIATLQAACFKAAWGEAAIAKLLEATHVFGFLAFDLAASQKRPIGFVLCRAAGGECEILSLGVCSEARGRGAAGQLLEAVAKEAAKRAASRIYLEVAVLNSKASALYRRHGFSEVGLRPGYYPKKGKPADDAHVLCRAL